MKIILMILAVMFLGFALAAFLVAVCMAAAPVGAMLLFLVLGFLLYCAAMDRDRPKLKTVLTVIGVALAGVVSAAEFVPMTGHLDETNHVFYMDIKKADLPQHWILESAVNADDLLHLDETNLVWQRVNLYVTHEEAGLITLSVPTREPVPVPGRVFRIRKLAD